MNHILVGGIVGVVLLAVGGLLHAYLRLPMRSTGRAPSMQGRLEDGYETLAAEKQVPLWPLRASQLCLALGGLLVLLCALLSAAS